MTIVVTKNNKPDTRMFDYEQAVARLGKEANKLQGVVDIGRQELADIGKIKAETEETIKLKKKELATIESEILTTITNGTKVVSDVNKKTQDSDIDAKKKKIELESLEQYLKGCMETIEQKTIVIVSLESKLTNLLDEVSLAKKELATVSSAVSDKQELLEVLLVQESDTRQKIQGLEEFLKSQAEKEQFLNRKEADLEKYEKRVEKSRKDLGNNKEMKFK